MKGGGSERWCTHLQTTHPTPLPPPLAASLSSPTNPTTCPAPQPGWYQRNSVLCRIVDDDGYAGCPYMFSNSKTCEQLTTLRPGCAGFFQDSYMSKFRTYGLVAVGAALIQVRPTVFMVGVCEVWCGAAGTP